MTRRGRVYAPDGITHRTMGKPITDAIDNLEASIDEGGNWKTFERALELVCSQRVQNVWKAETSKHSATKRKPTCSLSLCLPDSGLLQNQTTGTRQSARLLSLVFQPSGPPPPLVWHLLSVCVRWGGDPSSVVNIYNPNYSSHPTQQQRHAVGRLRVGAKHERHACVSRRKP